MTQAPQAQGAALPPLPKPDGDILVMIAGHMTEVDGWRASTIKAYAQACIAETAAERDRLAQQLQECCDQASADGFASTDMLNALRAERDRLRGELQGREAKCALLSASLIKAEAENDRLREAKDAAYSERNQVVAALAKCFPSGISRTAIEGWSEDWHGCVYIDLPTGQASWHYHDSHAHLFARLPHYTKPWDGHTTPEKYSRLAALAGTGEPTEVQRLRTVSAELLRALEAMLDWSNQEDPAYPDLQDDIVLLSNSGHHITVGDVRAARAVIASARAAGVDE